MSKLPESIPAVDVYEPPPDGWVCFFCGERFTTYGSAAMHFGWKPSATSACQIKVGQERGLVMEIRRLEEHNGNLREQNLELQRQIDAGGKSCELGPDRVRGECDIGVTIERRDVIYESAATPVPKGGGQNSVSP